ARRVGRVVADYFAAETATPVPAPSTWRAGAPLANVYHPGRLAVLRTCATAALPSATATPLQLVPLTPSLMSATGERTGRTASVTVQAATGALCSIVYLTRSGTANASQGLTAKCADSGGHVSWPWPIGSRTIPGMGTVTVTCDGASASAQISIG